jgi:hypothetical protein
MRERVGFYFLVLVREPRRPGRLGSGLVAVEDVTVRPT